MSNKKPVEFAPAQIVNLFRALQGVGGGDIPKARRISREIRDMPWLFYDPANGHYSPIPSEVPAECILHLKPSDLPMLWGVIKEDLLQEPTLAKLDLLESFSVVLQQEPAFANLMEVYDDDQCEDPAEGDQKEG